MATRRTKPGGSMWGLGAVMALDAVTGDSDVIPFPIGEAPNMPESAVNQARQMSKVTTDSEFQTFAVGGFVQAVQAAGPNPRPKARNEIAFWLMLMTQLTGWRYWALVALHTRLGDKHFLHEVKATSFDDAESQIKTGFRAILDQPIQDITERFETIAAKHWLH